MHGEGDEAVLDRNWLGLVKAEIANLLKLGFLLGSFLYLALLLTTISYFEGVGEFLRYARGVL